MGGRVWEAARLWEALEAVAEVVASCWGCFVGLVTMDNNARIVQRLSATDLVEEGT